MTKKSTAGTTSGRKGRPATLPAAETKNVRNAMAESKVTRQVDHGYLDDAAFETVAEGLQRHVATAIALHLKLKKFHWDIRGQLFRDLHLMYDELAAEVQESIDELAERLVMLGGSPVAAPSDVERLSMVTVPNEAVHGARQQLTQLVDDHSRLTRALRDDSSEAEEAGDVATADIYNGLLLAHDKHRWMLQAMLEGVNGD